MPKMITADSFLLAVVSVLKKAEVDTLVLSPTLDAKAADVYDQYFRSSSTGARPNFNFIISDIHGNSTRFREALNSLRFSDTLSFENPSFRRVKIKLDDAEADFFSRSVPDNDSLAAIVRNVFADEIATSLQPIA